MKEMCYMWECLSGPFHYELDTIVQPPKIYTEQLFLFLNPLVGLVWLWQNIIFVMLCGPAISEYITNIIRAQGHYSANVWNPGPLAQEFATLPPGHRCCIKCQISCISFVIFIKPVVCI